MVSLKNYAVLAILQSVETAALTRRPLLPVRTKTCLYSSTCELVTILNKHLDLYT